MTDGTHGDEQSRVAADCPNERLVIRCELTLEGLREAPLTDDYVIPRMLVAKGFKSDGGPLQPRLRGQIGCIVDFESGNYHYFQTGV